MKQTIRDDGVHLPLMSATRTRLKLYATVCGVTYDEVLTLILNTLAQAGESDYDAARRLAAEHAARQPARPGA